MNYRVLFFVVLVFFMVFIFGITYSIYSWSLKPHIVDIPNYVELNGGVQKAQLAVCVLTTGIIGIFTWIIMLYMLRGIRSLLYEMEQLSMGNLDIEIKMNPEIELGKLSLGLEKIQMYMRKNQAAFDEKVQEQTVNLKRKIQDLEKMKEMTTDSLLLAKKMQQERDQLLVQIQQLQDERKKK